MRERKKERERERICVLMCGGEYVLSEREKGERGRSKKVLSFTSNESNVLYNISGFIVAFFSIPCTRIRCSLSNWFNFLSIVSE